MNEKYEVVKFEQDGLTLDVNVSPSEDTVWLTQDAMALLFGKNQGVISRHINNIFKDGELDRNTSMQKMHKSRNSSNPNYRPPVYYNLDVVISVGYRVKSQNGLKLKEWLENYISDKNQEIIVYNNGIIQLDVRIEPMKETVWLSVNQIATLFETSIDNVYLHIKNIYDEGEVNRSVTEDSSDTQKGIVQTASDGKSYLTSFYNLDVILAVGYRVKGKRAIEFRRWATRVLKQYLLKGYVIDKQRTLVTNENYINLINKVNNLDDDVNKIKEILNEKVKNSFVCYEGKYYEGFSFINNLICTAKRRVVIIDGYADRSALDFFIDSKIGIKKEIICHKVDRIDPLIIQRFVKEYGNIVIKEDKSYHDRFLIIDDDIYILGASLNALGNKTSVITKTDQYKIKDIYKE